MDVDTTDPNQPVSVDRSSTRSKHHRRMSAAVRSQVDSATPHDELTEVVLEALYYEISTVRLDDVLELVHLVDEPEANSTTEDAIGALVNDAYQ